MNLVWMVLGQRCGLAPTVFCSLLRKDFSFKVLDDADLAIILSLASMRRVVGVAAVVVVIGTYH